MPGKIKRKQVNVILNTEEFERFKSYCELQGYKKSTLIARLIRDHLDSEGFQPQRPLPLETYMTGDN